MSRRPVRRGQPVFGRLLLLALCAVAPSLPPAVLAAPPAPGLPPSCKPLPPVEVRIVPLDEGIPGTTARFSLEVTPRLAMPREVRVLWLPASPALAWVEGERAATRPARRDEPLDFRVAVRVPRLGQQVLHCQVEVVTEGGAVWRRGVGVALGPEALAHRGRLAPSADGSAVLEFDAVPADRIAEDGR